MCVGCSRTGILGIEHPGEDGQTPTERALKQSHIPLEVLDKTELKRRYPNLRLNGNVKGVFERFAGILFADRAKRTIQVSTVMV